MSRFLFLLLSAQVALYGQFIPNPRITELAEDAGFNDEPTMARAGDGSYYVAWISFREGNDTLQVARYERVGEAMHSRGVWQIAGGQGTYILGPRMVAAGDSAYLLYAAEHAGNWEIFAVRCGMRGPEGPPVNLSRDLATDIKPAGAWKDATLWVAWESNRGGTRRILLSSLRYGKAGTTETVSATGRSNYTPSVAADGNGSVWVAWHSFRQDNYDVWLRERRPASWGPERRLTRAPSIDREAVLAAHGNEIWTAYQNTRTEGYLIGETNQRHLVLGKIAPEGLQKPAAANSPLDGRCESPTLAFDSLGRLWVAHLRPRLPRGGWEVHLTGYVGGRWVGPVRISLRKGMNRPPSLAIDGSRAVMLFQSDDFPETWAHGDSAFTRNARSRIAFVVAHLGNLPQQAVDMAFEPLEENRAPFEAGRLREEYGEDRETPSISYNGRQLKLFYGDLHAHSDVSVCNRTGDQTLDQNYQHRRDINGLNFVAMTDHDYNFVPYLWNRSAKLVRANEDPGRLLTFLAQEWTSTFKDFSPEHPYGYYGHRNVIFSDVFLPRWFDSSEAQTPAQLWTSLRAGRVDAVTIPHQLADTGNCPTDWKFSDEEAEPVAEIFQVRGSYEHRGAPREAGNTTPVPGYHLQDAWAAGKVIGVIASPDHGGGLGKACVYAPDLSRRSILEAIRQRHTFGVTAAKMILDVRVNGHLMGEKAPAPNGKPVEVRVRAECPAPIARIEICRNNRFIHTAEPHGRTADLTFVDPAPLPGRSYYYVRVIQTDNEIGWTSPVWLGAR